MATRSAKPRPWRESGQDGAARGRRGLGRQRPHLGAELVALAERGRHAVDGSRHLAAGAGSDREGRRHDPHVGGRVLRRRPRAPARRRPGRRARSGRAMARSSAPSGFGDLGGQRDQRRPDRVAGAESRREPIERVGQLPVAAASAHAGQGAVQSVDAARARRGRIGAVRGGGVGQPRAGRGGARREDERPRRPRPTSRAVMCTTRDRAAATPEHGERGAGGRGGRSGPARRRTRGPSASGGSITSATATIDRAPVAGSSDLHDEVERRARAGRARPPSGRSRPAESTITSRRRRASSGELAWHVDSEPSWPVFIAHNMSTASGPRTSPTMMRSGRMRSALRTSCRIVVAPTPSAVAGRASRRTTWATGRRSSAVSSTVTIRSPSGRSAAEGVEHGGLAGAGAAAHDHVRPRARPPTRGARPPREGRARRGGCGALRTGGS